MTLQTSAPELATRFSPVRFAKLALLERLQSSKATLPRCAAASSIIARLFLCFSASQNDSGEPGKARDPDTQPAPSVKEFGNAP